MRALTASGGALSERIVGGVGFFRGGAALVFFQQLPHIENRGMDVGAPAAAGAACDRAGEIAVAELQAVDVDPFDARCRPP